MRSRSLLPATVIRLVLCAAVAAVPVLISIPTQHHLVPVAYFMPLLFGVLGAVTLGESVRWLRPRNPLLVASRGAVTFSADALCLLPAVVVADGRPERLGIVAGAVGAMAVGMAVACVSQEFAWLAAAIVGFACLLATDPPLILSLPVAVACGGYAIALVAYSVLGPRGALD